MFLVGAEAGEWVVGLLPGCVASFGADGTQRISRGRRDGPTRGGPEGLFSCPDGPFIKRLLFLSTWPWPRPGFPHLKASFLSGGEEEYCQLKRRLEPGSPGSTGSLPADSW